MDKKAMIRVHVHLILHKKKILLRDDNIREVEISNMLAGMCMWNSVIT